MLIMSVALVVGRNSSALRWTLCVLRGPLEQPVEEPTIYVHLESVGQLVSVLRLRNLTAIAPVKTMTNVYRENVDLKRLVKMLVTSVAAIGKNGLVQSALPSIDMYAMIGRMDMHATAIMKYVLLGRVAMMACVNLRHSPVQTPRNLQAEVLRLR